MRKLILGLILVALMALGPVGVALATDDSLHDDGTLGIGAPYGPANLCPK